MKQIIITVLIVVGIIGGAIMFSGGEDSTAGAASNNFYGAEEGIITLTEFGDFECPGCAGFLPVISQVKEQFKDQLRFEFKHFPLVQIHQNATAAHRAAQAAANQGKFWEMHDLLYQRQQLWNGQVTSNPVPIFEGYAREIGLDMERYLAEVSSGEILGTINADISEGKELGTESTPTFYLDGVLVEDLSSISTVDNLTATINQALEAKKANNVYGNPDSQVVFTEFTDLQCPACAGVNPITKSLREEFNNEVRFEFKHFPLEDIHPLARKAHIAAQAAAEQGKFWEMKDYLFEKQDEWRNQNDFEDTLISYAESLDLDVDKFRNDMSSRAIEYAVNEDIKIGKEEFNITATPTFYLNGEKIDNNLLQNPDSLKDLIRSKL